MLERGFIDGWMNAMLANSTKCNSLKKVVSSYNRPLVKLSFYQIGVFFLIFTCGLISSAAWFAAEVMSAKGYKVKKMYSRYVSVE